MADDDEGTPRLDDVAAASRISKIARGVATRRDVRRKMIERAWNLLDANEEDRHIKRGKHVRDTISDVVIELGESDNYNTESGGRGGNDQQRRSSLVHDSDVGDVRSIPVEAGYDGVHLHFPLKRPEVLAMLEMFKQSKILHYRYVAQLLIRFKKSGGNMNTVQRLAINEGEKFTVVGDIHGQLQDLFTIFTINGLPSTTNRYLFNGDFVDRGSGGVEVFCTLLAFHFLSPGSVYFNRGNHEARAQTSWMGFEQEVLEKYCKRSDTTAGRKLYNLFMSCFDLLPLSALIHEKVFVCHGGLFRMDGVTLKHIEAIRRRREPPLEGTSLEDKIFEDLIWSDPRPTATYPGRLTGRRPSDRGAGVEFGPDVTNQFCITNSVALVLRSHECVQEGYEVLHDGRLITIFSASRYCGTQTNKGAFITFGPDLQPEIQQFYAHAMEATKFESEAEADDERSKALEVRVSFFFFFSSFFWIVFDREIFSCCDYFFLLSFPIDPLQEDALRMIIERVCDKKSDLYWYFTQHDEKVTGECSRLQWSEAMRTVLNLDLPFLHMQNKLCDANQFGTINYAKFLERYRIQMREQDQGWMTNTIQRVCQKLFQSCSSIEEAFKYFDLNDDGSIEYSEFVQRIKELNVGLTDNQIFELMRTIDGDGNSLIDMHEFSERFQISFDRIRLQAITISEGKGGEDVVDEGKGEEEKKTTRSNSNTVVTQGRPRRSSITDDTWVQNKLLDIGTRLFSLRIGLRQAFEAFDTNHSGGLSRDQFAKAMESIGMEIDADECSRLFAAVDEDETDNILWSEFVAAFQVDDTGGHTSGTAKTPSERSSWQDSVLQQISNSLFQHRQQIFSALRMMDESNIGTVSKNDFLAAMRPINKLIPHPLSSMQLNELAFALADDRGFIDYKSLLNNLKIVDTQSRSRRE